MKYIKTFEQFIENSNDESISEGKVSDIEKELEDLAKTQDTEDASSDSKFMRRVQKLQVRLMAYLDKKESYEKELEDLDAKQKSLSDESISLANKVKDNEANMKASWGKGGAMSFNSIMSDNKNMMTRIREITDELKQLNKDREKIYDKINSI